MANLDFISNQALVDANGNPYAGAKVYYYETGTTTPKAVYSNAGLTSAHSQPVVADSNGVVPPVYLLAGRYKRTVTTSADVNLSQYAVDPLDASSQLIASASAPAATYPFLRYHNTTSGRVFRRSADDTSWIDEGPVDSLISGATVSEVLTGTDTTKAVTPDAVAGLWQRGTDIASASTLSLPAGGGGVFNVTGTTIINGISSAQGGRCIKLRFASALTLTHNGTSFILKNNGANIVVAAGDTAEFINEAAADGSGSNWRMFSFERASGSPLNLTTFTATQTDIETGTSTSLFSTVGNMQHHRGMAKVWTNFNGSAVSNIDWNVTSYTDVGVSRWTVTIATDFSSAVYAAWSTAESSSSEKICGTRSHAAGSFDVLAVLNDGTSNETGLVSVSAGAFGDQ